MASVPGPTADEAISVETATGVLFGDLWGPYDDRLFEESVALFLKRLELAGFDTTWLRGKTCLDAGCGGGRSTVGLARMGARHVTGMDLGEEGLVDARRRARGLDNVGLVRASVLETPFPSGSLDFVWCAGVLMHTIDEHRALDELTRVLRPGGLLYLLVYATEGLRWPLMKLVRPLAAALGRESVERAIEAAGLPANKRRTFLDDLFTPCMDFYHWGRLEGMLHRRGFTTISRWGPATRLDHEADLAAYRTDLEALLALFAAGEAAGPEQRALYAAAHGAVRATVNAVEWFEDAVAAGRLSPDAAMAHVIGQGHHRVLCVKG